MTMLDYHRLRQKERDSWDLPGLEIAARERNNGFPNRARTLMPRPEEKFQGDLMDPIHTELDARVEQLCELYSAGTLAERTFLRSLPDLGAGRSLQGWGGRAAVFGLRSKSEHTLELGVIAHTIDDLASGDARDTLIAVTILHHAARRIECNANAVFLKVAGIAGPAFGALARDFAGRHPDLQSLRCMGWREVETPAGPGFTWHWPKR